MRYFVVVVGRNPEGKMVLYSIHSGYSSEFGAEKAKENLDLGPGKVAEVFRAANNQDLREQIQERFSHEVALGNFR